MTWYAAHLILYVRYKDRKPRRVPVWENIVLIKADSEGEAFAKAEKRGHEEEGDDDGTFRWGNHPAEWVFAGVRKLTLCQDEDQRPRDGTEVTFLELELPSESLVRKLASGEPVSVKLADQFADEELEDSIPQRMAK